MKKRKLFLLPLFCLLLTGCGSHTSDQGGEGDGGKGKEEREKLATPVLTLNDAKSGLTWAAIADAVGYSIKVNEADPTTVTTPGYAFATEVGQYSVKIAAKADDAKYDSLPASYSYETKQTSLGELSFADGAISWASLVGLGVEIKLGDGEFTKVTGTSAAVTQDGTYTLRAIGGFDETNKILYVAGTAGTKEIVVNTRVPLAAPVLTVKQDGTGLTWEAVEGAVKYSIKVGDEDAVEVTEPGYAFATEAGEYIVTVKALADVAAYDSQAATYSYETVYTAVGALSFDGTNVAAASFVGLGLEYKLDGAETYTAIADKSFIPTAPGAYVVHAKAGFDADAKKFYVSDSTSPDEKVIILSAPGTTKVIEDGSEEDTASLKEKYNIKYYDGNDNTWKNSSSAQLALNTTANAGYTQNGCAALTYHTNGNAFRFQQTGISFNGELNQLSLAVKGDAIANMTIQLMILGDKKINGTSLTGIYAEFNAGLTPNGWCELKSNINGSNWKVYFDNKAYSFAELAPALEVGYNIKVYSLAQLMPYFDTVNVILKNKGVAGTNTSLVYIDDFQLAKVAEAVDDITPFDAPTLKDSYDFITSSVHGFVLKSGDDRYLKMGAVQLPVSVEIVSKKLVMTSVVPDNDFVLTALSADGGNSFAYVSASGTKADILKGLTAVAIVKVLDDFDSYTATGTGYDTSNKDIASCTGLRAAYYSDWNNTPGADNKSLLDDNWSIMGSNNYLNLASDGGNNVAKMKINGSKWMRYIRADVMLGSAEAYPTATRIGFTVKGAAVKQGVKLRIYYVQQVVKGAADSNRTYLETSFAAGSYGYLRYFVTLDSTKTYYGFSIALANNETNGAKTDGTNYITIDNICLY